METRKIRITEADLNKLRKTIVDAMRGEYRNSVYLRELEKELDRAEIVPSREIGKNVITMNSKAQFKDLESGDVFELTLVYPEDSHEGEDVVSILAPIGTAMLGYQVGDEFSWQTPGGSARLKVEKILYQPESAGEFD